MKLIECFGDATRTNELTAAQAAPIPNSAARGAPLPGAARL